MVVSGLTVPGAGKIGMLLLNESLFGNTRATSRIGIRQGVVAIVALLASFDLACAEGASFGQRLYQDKADCQFCHGPDGDGRGDPRSPGKASNLHKTILSRDQLIEVIACGRPASEMPHFEKYAYEDKACYGLSAAELGTSSRIDDAGKPPAVLRAVDPGYGRGQHKLSRACSERLM